jgi:ATP phosphoribosyltransferase regulatory subunit
MSGQKGFPSYDAALLEALEAQAAAMLGVFGAKGYERVEPPVLQPADLFLDRSGEEIRRRTFVFADPMGHELCLRPDLTIPVCRMALERGRFPARLAYHGPAFRFQAAEPDRPNQFLQTGVEFLGARNAAAADSEVLQLAVEAVRAAGLNRFTVRVGDLGLFASLVDALDIPAQWRARLKRHFWRPGYFKELLERLTSGKSAPGAQVLAQLGKLDVKQASAKIEAMIDAAGGSKQAVLGGRTREEIVERMLEQAAEAAAVKLDKRAVAVIEKVLGVSGDARKSVGEIRKIAGKAGITLDAPLAAMERRIAALAELKLAAKDINFAAHFGRNIEYYTGFVFELWSYDSEGAVQIAGGGRYDTLLKSLGAAKAVPAVGCAVRPERVLAARRKAGARP